MMPMSISTMWRFFISIFSPEGPPATHHQAGPVQSDTGRGRYGPVQVPGIWGPRTFCHLEEEWGQSAWKGPAVLPAGAWQSSDSKHQGGWPAHAHDDSTVTLRTNSFTQVNHSIEFTDNCSEEKMIYFIWRYWPSEKSNNTIKQWHCHPSLFLTLAETTPTKRPTRTTQKNLLHYLMPSEGFCPHPDSLELFFIGRRFVISARVV